jgi:hypothetical protein
MDLGPFINSHALSLEAMTKFKITSVAAAAIAGTAVSLVIHYRSQAACGASVALQQEQGRQMAALTVEREHLSNLAAHAAGARAQESAAELKRLRSEVEALKKQTNDLGRALVKSHDPPASRPASIEHTPEYWAQLHQMAGARMEDAKILGMAFEDYAFDHQQQSPLNLDQLAAYLAKAAADNRSLSGTNQFELVYQGSLDKLQGLPWGSVAVVRDQQSWPDPDGKMMRVYGFPDGHSQIVGCEFQSAWEAQHVISSPATSPSGQ